MMMRPSSATLTAAQSCCEVPMNIAFAGLRHDHIFALAALADKKTNYHITGWWENDRAARLIAAKSFSQPSYDSFDALITDERVDVVAVGDYYGNRGRLVIAALKAGKHVIADKPLCTSLDELNEIAALIHDTGLKLGCMLDLRYEPCLRHLSGLVSDGFLGQIKTASFTGQHPLNWGVRPSWYFEEGKQQNAVNYDQHYRVFCTPCAEQTACQPRSICFCCRLCCAFACRCYYCVK